MTTAPELTQVRAAHRFDEAALADHLAGRLPGFRGPLRVLQFEGGQSNPTFRLEWDGGRAVLRKKPPGELLRSAHQVEREYRVLTALRGTGVPVPETLLSCEDPSVIGTPFYVMECVEGRVVPDPALPGFSAAERRSLYDDVLKVLARLHAVDPGAVGLGDFGRPGNYYERQISRWSRQYQASRTETIPAMDALIEWLPAHLPDADETRVVHGDYRIGNLVLHPKEPRVVAVLDWELSTLGHPLGDLAYFCQGYRTRGAPGQTLYGADLEALGIPDEAAVVERYCELAGRGPIEDWTFYLVFVLFRTAAIVQGVYRRSLDGNAASERAGQYGAAVHGVAERAWQMAREAS